MIESIFRNVGQGDSIILEWESEKKKKLGIIDCKSNSDANPVLDYIIKENYTSIGFLFLSHPHIDHFSGFNQLINYCIDKNIRIDYFLHTCNNMPSFWKMAVDSKIAETELLKLFHLIRIAKHLIG